MNVELLLIAKVYRKKEVQQITDRSTGRVSGEFYPVILDDGENTIDATVPRECYETIEEDKIYCFRTRFNDNYARENQKSKPRIEGIMYEISEDWRKDFVNEFRKQTYDSFNVPFSDSKSVPASATAAKTKAATVKTTAKDEGLPFN